MEKHVAAGTSLPARGGIDRRSSRSRSTSGILATALALVTILAASDVGPFFVEGSIQCHYCGIRRLCQLPFDQEAAETITCDQSCMKFDGFADDGKRIIVRSCGHEDLNTWCNASYDWNGSKGTYCLCNSANCNPAEPTTAFHLSFKVVVLGLGAALVR